MNTWFFCVSFPYCLRLTNKIEWEQRLKAKPTEGNLKPETQDRERPHSHGEQNRGRKKTLRGTQKRENQPKITMIWKMWENEGMNKIGSVPLRCGAVCVCM